MNLFNVLKYPISDHPTEAELAALPDDLFAAWLAHSGWSEYHIGYHERFVIADYYNAGWAWSGVRTAERHVDIALLRKMIDEYEPIQCTKISN
jgi:hypothetical protein